MGVDGRGGLAISRYDRDIEQSIVIILSTARGERVMRPEFGSGIHDFIFAPYNATTAGLLAYHVQESLARWEPRIEVTGVDVEPVPGDSSQIMIDIRYVVKGTNDERNLVYPFYLIPTEE
jgi:phage baseplate assembly protein W